MSPELESILAWLDLVVATGETRGAGHVASAIRSGEWRREIGELQALQRERRLRDEADRLRGERIRRSGGYDPSGLW